MRLHKWEVTIQQMVDECSNDEDGADRIMKSWRTKLEKEPSLLEPFRIDGIVREVRERLSKVSP
jgi:hypothetical protein